MRARRHPHRRLHRGGFRSPLTTDGLFVRCPAAAAAAATATEMAAAANEAAVAAAQRAAATFAEVRFSPLLFSLPGDILRQKNILRSQGTCWQTCRIDPSLP